MSMKRWEEDRRVKRFKAKIRSAKPTVVTRQPLTAVRSSAVSGQRSADTPETSLKVYLRRFQLQQYFKVSPTQKLDEEGFATNLPKLLDLSDREIDGLLERLRLLPGHRGKFAEMLAMMRHDAVRSAGRGRLALWTARSMSPVAVNKSPAKYYRALSIEAGSPRPLISTKESVGPDLAEIALEEEQKRLLEEELAQARLKIMLLEHQIHETTKTPKQLQPLKAETPPILSRKSLVFEESQPQKDKPQSHRKEVGVSYDSCKMRSTLVNLDIEEMCKCLATALASELRARTENGGSVIESGFLPSGLVERYADAFFEPFRTRLAIDEIEIYNFTKNILIRSKMEKEIVVICLVYLNRVAGKGGLALSEQNWKRLVFTAMILGSKVWDDDSYENKNFAQAFTMYTAEEINSMEGSFLALIDFELKVTGSEYAQAYFLLRTFTKADARSFPLRALNVETVLRLQSNAQNAESALKDIHAEALYKTL